MTRASPGRPRADDADPPERTGAQGDRRGDPAPPGAGDADIYALLYRTERGPLTWFLRSHGLGEHEAEDAVQAAFVRLLRARETIRKPRRWLRTVALNEHRRSTPSVPGTRRRTVVVPTSPADLPDLGDGGSATTPTELSDQARWAHEAIAALPDKQRQVMARHFDGWSSQQIADGLGMSNATVRQNLHRARRALSKRFRTTSEDDT